MSTDHDKEVITSLEGQSFEEAFSHLEETVQALEQGGLTLEEATHLYQKGVELARVCNQLLEKAELKVTQLKTAYADYLSDRPADYLASPPPEAEE